VYLLFSASLCSQAKVFPFAGKHFPRALALPGHCITNSDYSLVQLMLNINSDVQAGAQSGTLMLYVDICSVVVLETISLIYEVQSF